MVASFHIRGERKYDFVRRLFFDLLDQSADAQILRRHPIEGEIRPPNE